MPTSRTFQIKPISELIHKYAFGNIIDPFANDNKIATVTNDLNPEYDTDFHMDATDFLKMFDDNSVDTVLYDPPYSPRQVSECYKNLGRTVNMQTTQACYWSKQKEQIGRIVKPNGIVITCSWNSGGIGKKYGFEIAEILLVPHGGWLKVIPKRITDEEAAEFIMKYGKCSSLYDFQKLNDENMAIAIKKLLKNNLTIGQIERLTFTRRYKIKMLLNNFSGDSPY